MAKNMPMLRFSLNDFNTGLAARCLGAAPGALRC
jgi:hypothetical protein